jgi:hypothetical protein
MTKPSTDALFADEDSAALPIRSTAAITDPRSGRNGRSVPGQTRRALMIGAGSALTVLTALATVTGFGSVASAATTSSADVLLSQGRPATASSIEDSRLSAALADDAKTTTRWSSDSSDAQWIKIDLGTVSQIHHVKLQWETAYASGYQVQTSANGTKWTSVYSTTTGNGGIDDLTGLKASGRYIRINGTKRATTWGYSLWNFQVYGTTAAAPAIPAPPRTTPPTTPSTTPAPDSTATPLTAKGTPTSPPVSGLPAGTVLHSLAGMTITKAGTVIDGADITAAYTY